MSAILEDCGEREGYQEETDSFIFNPENVFSRNWHLSSCAPGFLGVKKVWGWGMHERRETKSYTSARSWKKLCYMWNWTARIVELEKGFNFLSYLSLFSSFRAAP